ncbi:uncharacterized protein LOC127719769 [Mytilus californianus]|uniref:uncharacterized protein LOC127719769 n=1 Tax=Mytilus californianus TaxID=6549 RepID=UPI0022470BCA|nr:uncharacterized protein LOC127719769 [Mytilus californianus]
MESIVFDSYRILTTEVAFGLSQDDIKIIKFLIRSYIGRGDLEKIITGTDLIQLLEGRCMLSAENVEQLSRFLQLTGRNDLNRKVEQYIESAISKNLSNHDYYGLRGMYVPEHYIETSEYHKLCQHMLTNNAVILKGPPGTWKSWHAFRYAQEFSKMREKDTNSLIWRIDCNSELNIYNSLTRLMNYLKIQDISADLRIQETINNMLLRAVAVLESNNFKNTKHLFILLGFISPQKNFIHKFLKKLNDFENISVIVTTSEPLFNDFDNIVVNLYGMTENEAIRYLNVDDTLDEKAKELAKRLSYLPGGLAFAKTYIHTTGISIDSYLERLEKITTIEEYASIKACEMVIVKAEENMSVEEKTIFSLISYLNTDNIPLFILKSLLPETLNKDEKAIIMDNFLRTLEKYSLVVIKGNDEQRVISAHEFTFMVVKASKTCAERNCHLKKLLNFFMCFIDLDARWLEVIHRNVLLLEHAEAFLSHFVGEFPILLHETKAKLCYIYCAIGITYRLYGNTELSANTYLEKAKSTMYETFLSGQHIQFSDIKTDDPYTTMNEYLNGNGVLQENCEIIFNILVEIGKELPLKFIDTFIENKYRHSRIIDLLRNYGGLCTKDIHNNQLSAEVVSTLRSKNLIMESKYIAETFLVELLIRILYNSSKNKWLMQISKDSCSIPETEKMRDEFSSTYVPVTPESLVEHQLAHSLAQLLQQHLSSLPMQHDRIKSTQNTVRSFCPVFRQVTHRSGVLYMLRSFSNPDRLSYLLKEAIELLNDIDSNIESTGFTEFGVVKRIGDSSLFQSVMIERIKMECHEKLYKLERPDELMKGNVKNKQMFVEPSIPEDESIEECKSFGKTNLPNMKDAMKSKNLDKLNTPGYGKALSNQNLKKALSIANELEKNIDDMTSWKALSGIHLKIAQVFKLTETEENIRKAKHHYKKAFDREYESNNTRLTRFHLKAVVQYAECCIQFPNEDDLHLAKQLSKAMQHRFRSVKTGTLFEEVIKDIDKCLVTLTQKKQSVCSSTTKIKPEVHSKSTQDDDYADEETWLLKELNRKKDRLDKYLSTLREDYKQLKCDIEMIELEKTSVEKEIAHIEIQQQKSLI